MNRTGPGRASGGGASGAGRARHRRVAPEPVVAEVERLAGDGRGVVRVDGKTVFVDGALPGETVRFVYCARHRNFDEARILEVIRAGPERVAPRCPHFDLCGGCNLQHLSPQAQLRHKQDHLLENLRRTGGVEPAEVFEPLRGPEWGYRHKARIGVRHVAGKARVLVGFRERHSSKVADLAGCEVLARGLGARLPELAALIASLEIGRRIPRIEIAAGDTETALVFRHLAPPGEGDRARLLAFGAEHGLRIFVQPGGADTVRPLDEGASRLHYRLPEQDVEIAFAPTDFIQVNAAMNRRLVTRVLELLALSGSERVLDLFCGLGNFTLAAARRAAEVTGVEGLPGLVERARANAHANGLDHARFHVADLTTPDPRAPWLAADYDRVLLDPPRSGAREVLPLIGRLRAPSIVYVSCHPATLARDAAVLVHEMGYRLTGAGVLDMFPHTAHVESAALFEYA